ncbi:hypothetical protein ACIQUZ_35145 [Streptomyces griseus]|nr:MULTISPECIES: hypothetical protein [Streptomyces]EGE45761.1 hypothetical protein SACT1_6459 [Streptomyces sp. ACT-1]SBV03297.1 hypothetical protein YW3DRAFT_06996 [Streptomyces sp. MnatMP-M77]
MTGPAASAVIQPAPSAAIRPAASAATRPALPPHPHVFRTEESQP